MYDGFGACNVVSFAYEGACQNACASSVLYLIANMISQNDKTSTNHFERRLLCRGGVYGQAAKSGVICHTPRANLRSRATANLSGRNP